MAIVILAPQIWVNVSVIGEKIVVNPRWQMPLLVYDLYGLV